MNTPLAPYDFSLANDCAAAISGVAEIGCLVSGSDGSSVASFGYSCATCGMCTAMGKPETTCSQAQLYGMTESERFGGKYIYYCPMGLTCFVSPILGEIHSAAKITVGPFLMVDPEDFIACELDDLSPEIALQATTELQNVPVFSPQKIQKLSTLLFMAVGFINKVSAGHRLLAAQEADALQGQINSYILHFKNEQSTPPYPFATENALLKSIAAVDRDECARLLNELMGHILFTTGHDFELVKSRMLELLTMMGRAVISAGANEETTLALCHESRMNIQGQRNTEDLCYALNKSSKRLMDSVFQLLDVRHANAIKQCTEYIDKNYYEKITLELLAQKVYLSPTYLSRIFREETGVLFSTYLNEVRIKKAKALLLHADLRLTDIAMAIGFEDQSYFTKVFKRIVGVTPLHYRAQIETADKPYH